MIAADSKLWVKNNAPTMRRRTLSVMFMGGTGSFPQAIGYGCLLSTQWPNWLKSWAVSLPSLAGA